MKIKIDVKDQEEGAALRAGLAVPEIRAHVVVFGILAPLSARARQRVLAFVQDKLEEERPARHD